jgi:hypothetical protein
MSCGDEFELESGIRVLARIKSGAPSPTGLPERDQRDLVVPDEESYAIENIEGKALPLAHEHRGTRSKVAAEPQYCVRAEIIRARKRSTAYMSGAYISC